MPINSIRHAIEQRFRDNWTGTDIDSGVRYSNDIFDPPKATSWAAIDVRWLPTIKTSISSAIQVRRKGMLIIDIFSPIDKGTSAISVLGDEAITIFENAQFAVTGDAIGTFVQMGSADIRHIGVPNIQGTDPMWYKFSIRIIFYRDE